MNVSASIVHVSLQLVLKMLVSGLTLTDIFLYHN